ncbi:MAG: hypothetical protein K8963_04185 [Proteobacteria bacterium]|nr:hypothetical protein [Pseudomonadota bacterium]
MSNFIIVETLTGKAPAKGEWFYMGGEVTQTPPPGKFTIRQAGGLALRSVRWARLARVARWARERAENAREYAEEKSAEAEEVQEEETLNLEMHQELVLSLDEWGCAREEDAVDIARELGEYVEVVISEEAREEWRMQWMEDVREQEARELFTQAQELEREAWDDVQEAERAAVVAEAQAQDAWAEREAWVEQEAYEVSVALDAQERETRAAQDAYEVWAAQEPQERETRAEQELDLAWNKERLKERKLEVDRVEAGERREWEAKLD